MHVNKCIFSTFLGEIQSLKSRQTIKKKRDIVVIVGEKETVYTSDQKIKS